MSENQKLLVVDDEDIERDIISSYLRFAGYHVLQAPNGKEALNILSEQKIDLVLLDVQMPIMNGFETIYAMKNNTELQDIPVIFLTSLDKPNLYIKGLEEGALHYLTKPVNKAILLATIKSVLKNTNSIRFTTQKTEKLSDLTGKLEKLPLEELLQSIEVNSKTAHINLPNINSFICIENGIIVQITQGKFKGKKAFERMMFLHQGNFNVTFDKNCNKKDENINIMYLLMDTARETDERNLLLKDLPDLNTLVTVKSQTFDKYPELKKFKYPIPLKTLIAELDGFLSDNINFLIDLKLSDSVIFEK